MEEDTHLCLVCDEKIVGLMNYVTHKQVRCFSKKQKETVTVEPDAPAPLNKPKEPETGSIADGKSDGLLQNTIELQPVMKVEPRPSAAGGGSITDLVIGNIQGNANSQNPLPYEERLPLDITQLNHFINEDFNIPNQTSPRNQVVSLTSPTTDSFFQSLELQSRKSPRAGKTEVPEIRTSYHNLDNLSISNFLDNLDFSSDDDLTNFDELDNSDEDWNDGNPPRNHTGGKWKPGEYPGLRSNRTPSKKVTGGKWKPGMLAKSNEKQTKKKAAKSGSKTFECKACDMTFTRGILYSCHCRQRSHKEKLALLKSSGENTSNELNPPAVVIEKPDQEAMEGGSINEVTEGNKDAPPSVSQTDSDEIMKEVEKSVNENKETEEDMDQTEEAEDRINMKTAHICTVCDKKFSRKHEIVQHLMTKYHKNRAMNHPDKLDMIVKYERYIVKLSAYQCGICKFYFNKHSDLLDHVTTANHSENCDKAIGEITCLLCNRIFETAEDLANHVNSEEHNTEISKATNSKICVLKEVVDLTCKYCGAKQSSVNRLKRHIIARHKDKKYTSPMVRIKGGYRPKCDHCSYVAPYRSSLKVHIRRMHTDERPFPCFPCNKNFADKYSYDKHLKTPLHSRKSNLIGGGEKLYVSWTEDKDNVHVTKAEPRSKREIRCDKCEFTTSRYKHLKAHSVEAHAEEIKRCELCSMTFLTIKAYRVHCSGKSHQAKMELSPAVKEGEKQEPILQCNKCSKKFTDQKWMNLHIQFIHNHISTEEELQKMHGDNNKVVQLYGDHLEQIKSMPSDASVSCPECGKFIHHERIVEHLRIHTGEKPFVCNICNRGFIGRLSLRRHLMVHVGLTENTCNICNKEFKRYNSYKMHMELHGSHEKHICPVCGQTFLLQKQLTYHLKRHGDRPHKCPVKDCTWSFVLRNELSIHLLTHTGEKKYLCDTCGFAAATKSRLQRHKRTHTGERLYHCEYCTYKAGNNTHLRRHMRIHIGAKPFQCPYCPYTCNTHENIRKHITKTKKHEGKPVYSCTLCDYGTNGTKEFRAHLVTVHSDTVKLDSLDKLAEYSGLYKKAEDPSKPIEGKQILPTKERHGRRRPKSVKVQTDTENKGEEQIAFIETVSDSTIPHGELGTIIQCIEDKPTGQWSTNTSGHEVKHMTMNIPTVAYQAEMADEKLTGSEYTIIQGGTYTDLSQVGNYENMNMMNVIVLEGQFTQQ